MEFFIEMIPPTATAQEKQVRVAGGRPIFYDPAPVKAAKKQLMAHLAGHYPEEPLTGPLELRVVWYFPKGRTHKVGEWRTRDQTRTICRSCSRTV